MPRRNAFSWSVSRMKEFDFCLRHYYWMRYGSWGGYRADSSPEAREAFILKYMTSLSHYVGRIIHRTCARFWRDWQKERWLSEEKARHETIRALYAGVGESERGGWRRRVSSGTHLFEHEYGQELSEERLGKARDRITRSLAGFYTLGLVQRAYPEGRRRGQASRGTLQVASIEKREHFELAGTAVHLVMDLVVQEPDRGYVIWDWKSGEEAEVNEFQGAVYALYGQWAWGVPVDRLRMRIAYLRPQRVQELVLTTELLAQTQAQIEASVAAMRARLRDVEENVAHIDDFPMTDDLSRCSGCVFKRLCGRE